MATIHIMMTQLCYLFSDSFGQHSLVNTETKHTVDLIHFIQNPFPFLYNLPFEVMFFSCVSFNQN